MDTQKLMLGGFSPSLLIRAALLERWSVMATEEPPMTSKLFPIDVADYLKRDRAHSDVGFVYL